MPGIIEEAFQDMKYDDLPEQYKFVADCCGLDVAKKLIIEMGGLSINIPIPKSIRPVMSRYAKTSGKSVKKIALAFQCSERYVKRLKASDLDK